MKIIHKIVAMAIEDDQFLMVRKNNKDIWTSLGGKPENGETEKETLLREIKEEIGCRADILEKLGDFEAKAVFDDAIVCLSAYLVKIKGKPKVCDKELAEIKFIDKYYKSKRIELPPSIEDQIIPCCVKLGLLKW